MLSSCSINAVGSPRIEFQRDVKETKAEHHARGFTSWGQFVAIPIFLVIPARPKWDVSLFLKGKGDQPLPH